ncbi:hypothetical protein [Chryseobacterium pennipullorum]|uniref:Lipoprotein n=1 Tax=Chryseobacterium pennipullorum TaxID=2258963 RepID=A0A3D9BAJ7_9FLAO|nr:hypothetical protein [Chryseobacterium pennipullorum]REC50397.1 hypothetical protein DRF67_02390 [Chryseobacterium pennipullorum]
MQKNIYLIIISFALTSCYTYQVKKQVDTATATKQDSKRNAVSASNTSAQINTATADPQNMNPQPMPVAVNVQDKLTPGKNVKIHADGRSYKIIVDRWESDSLVAHPVRNPNKTLKFHKSQINGEKIGEKRFSQPIADIITVTAYAGIAATVWYLLR